MGIGVISNRYLDFEKIKFLITCFEKIQDYRMQLCHHYSQLDPDTKLCCDFLFGYGTLCHTKRYEKYNLIHSDNLFDAYKYILTGFHSDGSEGTAPEDLRELAAFVLEYGDSFDLAVERVRRTNRDFYDEITSEFEAFHSHQ